MFTRWNWVSHCFLLLAFSVSATAVVAVWDEHLHWRKGLDEGFSGWLGDTGAPLLAAIALVWSALFLYMWYGFALPFMTAEFHRDPKTARSADVHAPKLPVYKSKRLLGLALCVSAFGLWIIADACSYGQSDSRLLRYIALITASFVGNVIYRVLTPLARPPKNWNKYNG